MNNLHDIIPGESFLYNTLSKQLSLVRGNATLIRQIKNPSEQVQLAAVQQDGWTIYYIPNPSEQVQIEAVKQSSDAILYIDNPSEQVQIIAIQQYGPAIGIILRKGIVPSIAVQRVAALRDPLWALHVMTVYNIPISKMIQWFAAKRIKERNLFEELDKDILDKLDLDVQNYLKSEP